MNIRMILVCLALLPNAVIAAEAPLSPELAKFAKKLVATLKLKDAAAYKKLIHPDCPIDEGRIQATVSNAWTDRYSVRAKKVSDAFDPALIQFRVPAETVLEFQVWTKISDPGRIKAMHGKTEIELVTGVPVGRHGKELKALIWPCFDNKK